jgi:hypothetical protein
MSALRLQVVIPARLDAQIRKAAERQGISKSQWVRRVLNDALAADPGDALGQLSRLGAPIADIGHMLAEIRAGRG